MTVRRTALVAVALGLALTGLVAAVAAVATEPPSGLPGRVQVPAPRVGDRAHYDVQQPIVNRSWLLVPYDVTGVDAEWLAPTTAEDAHGVVHTVATLALRADYVWHDGSFSSTVFQETAYDTTTWQEVAVTNHEEFPRQVQTGSLVEAPGIHLNDNTVTVRQWFETEMRQAMRGPCGFVGALQAGAASGQDVRLGGRCGRVLLNEPDGDTFRMAAVEEAAGVPAVRFDDVDHPRSQVWANPGIPFPVRVRDDFVDLFDATKTGCCLQDWRLAAFEPGTQPYAPGPTTGTPAPLPTAAAPAGLPDESGTEHAFPASAALARLMQEPDIARFMADAPGAYVGESHAYHTQDEAGRVAWHHLVVLTDGHGQRARHVYQDLGGGPSLDPQHIGLPRPGGDPASLLAEATGRVVVEPWPQSGFEDGDDVTGLYPTPQQRAKDLPRVQEAVAAFLAGANDTIRSKPVGWGVVHACWGDCGRPMTLMRVNVLQDPVVAATRVPDALQPRGLANAALNLDADGAVLSLAKRTQSPASAGLLTGAQDAQWKTESRPVAGATARPAYLPVAAVAGGLALAGLAAWLLWGAKAGAAGLFSRIEGPRLLEHKGRAAIVQAIEAEPGIHFSELARRSGHAAGALRHHLGKLEDAGLVVARPLGGYTCYFAPGASRDPDALANAAARSDGARKVLEALQAGVTGVRAIAQRTGLSPSTVSHHLKRLQDAGLAAPGARAGVTETQATAAA